MQYKFDPKIQTVYAITGFVLCLIVLYMILGEINWVAAVIVGIGNFLVSGYYTESYRTCE